MSGRPCGTALTLLTMLAMSACADDTPSATASPSPSASSVAGAADFTSQLPDPGTGPVAPPPAGSAAQVIADAAKRNVAAISMRIKMTITESAASAPYTVAGKGELERPGRAHMALTLTGFGRTFESESVTYDGTVWTRSGPAGTWKRGGKPSVANTPDAFVRYIDHASAVRDAGRSQHAGHDTERYNALIPVPSAQPATLPPSLAVWVDRASGLVVGEEIVETAGAGSRTLDVAVDFQDIGAPITVVRPG